MEYKVMLALLTATLAAGAALADEAIPPVVAGHTYTQHLVMVAKAHHPEIASIVVSGSGPHGEKQVVLGSSSGAGAVFQPAAAAGDGAGPSADGRQFRIREPFNSSSGHRIGTIELRFPYRHGQATAPLRTIARSVQAEMARSTLSAKNAIDPYPYVPALSGRHYAQTLVDRFTRSHPDLLVMMIHATPPQGDKNIVIGSNIGRIGKIADEDDLRVIDQGATNLEIGGDNDRFETELPLNDAHGKRIGALGLVFSYHNGDDRKALQAHGIAIRDELARAIPDSAALFSARR